MFEARLTQGKVFKQLIEAVKELVTDANIDCKEEEMSVLAMDSSHVSLVSISLRSSGFDHFRCDIPLSLGINTANLSKILKCAGNEDIITLKSENESQVLTLMFEDAKEKRIADFDLNLMEIEADQLGIPETEYKCNIKMPSAEFQRIIRDMNVLGDACTISVTKEGVRFSVTGDLGTGNVLLKHDKTGSKDEGGVTVDMEEPVELTFALRYLNLFAKAGSLGETVVLCMSPDVPLVVEYPIEDFGHIKYYLAPKIDENEE